MLEEWKTFHYPSIFQEEKLRWAEKYVAVMARCHCIHFSTALGLSKPCTYVALG